MNTYNVTYMYLITVLILSVLVSAFFTFLYSIDWGSEVANQWLVSQIVGTLENIVLFQSIKVSLVHTMHVTFLALLVLLTNHLNTLLGALFQVFLLAIFFAVVLRLPTDPVDSNDVTIPVWRPPDDRMY